MEQPSWNSRRGTAVGLAFTLAHHRFTIRTVIIYILSSGSSGNSVFVRSGETRVLIDAGLPGSTIKRYLEKIDETAESVDSVLLTHEHRDHTRGAGVLSRRYGMTVHATPGTFLGSQHITNGISPDLSVEIAPGDRFAVGDISVHAVSTPHDARDSVGYVLESEGIRFGVFTDFGHGFDELKELIPTLDGMMLECNYDDEMLENGPYPPVLKKRIRGPRGHLSNDDAADLLAEYAGTRLRTVVLSHLSEENNRPELATEALVRRLPQELFDRLGCIVARRGYPTQQINLKER